MFISHFKSLSGKARHQGLLTHDREDSFTTEMGKRLPQRSPAPLAMPLASVLVTICLLLWMVQNAITTCKSDSLVGGNSKRMMLTPLSSSCVGSYSRQVISPSLTTPNFFSEAENDALPAIESSLFGSDICSLLPLYNTMAILVITYVILFLPYTAEYVISA